MLDGKPIIIIDDSPLIASSIEQIATDLGGHPLAFRNVESMLSEVSSDETWSGIAIVDGLSVRGQESETLAWLQQRSTPAIFLSTNKPNEENHLAAYAARLVLKPFSDQEMADAIRSLLGES